jgi:hypothetical protein
MATINSSGLKQGPVADSSQRGNDICISIEGEELLQQLKVCSKTLIRDIIHDHALQMLGEKTKLLNKKDHGGFQSSCGYISHSVYGTLDSDQVQNFPPAVSPPFITQLSTRNYGKDIQTCCPSLKRMQLTCTA